MAATTLIPCRGGPGGTGWLRVPDPPPLEVRRSGGTFVLDGDAGVDRRYVFVEEAWASRRAAVTAQGSVAATTARMSSP